MKQAYIFIITLIALLSSCSKEQSYSELLRDEEKTINWYLSQQRVELNIPEDSVFITGKDAPYYKMDEDGHVYMQVISPGDRNSMAVKGDLVYFRYMQMNLRNLQDYGTEIWTGNAENLGIGAKPTSFVFGNNYLPSTTQYGTGIQVPLKYLGYDCEVNLVIKSIEGFTDNNFQCIPYVMNVRYFKAEF